MEDISASLESHPQKYTAWFHLAYPKVEEWIKNEKSEL
jgi:isopentenyl-diphosphate delta-isomerase